MEFEGVKRYFLFSCAWAFGSIFDSQSKTVFNHWWRRQFGSHCVFPEDGEIWDYYIDSDRRQFVKWSDSISPYSVPHGQGMSSDIFVHNVQIELSEEVTEKISCGPTATATSPAQNPQLLYFLNHLSSAGWPVMLVGEAGCGKTGLMHELIDTLSSGDMAEILQQKHLINRSTNPRMIWENLMERLEWQHGTVYLPRGNKKLLYLLDDLNLAEVDHQGQPACEIVRQLLDCGGAFDPIHFKWKTIKNVVYLATINDHTTARVPRPSQRLLKHFSIFHCAYPSSSDQHGIFSSLLNAHFLQSTAEHKAATINANDHLRDLLSAITSVTIETQERLRTMFLGTSQRCHYIFTLRDLSKIFRSLCLSLDGSNSTDKLLYLWRHECDWIYGHRMASIVDYNRYKQEYIAAVKKVFTNEEQLQLIISPHQPLFSNVIELEGGLITAASTQQNLRSVRKLERLLNRGVLVDGYQHTFDTAHVRKLLEEATKEYNKANPRMNISFYNVSKLYKEHLKQRDPRKDLS
nr:PREDICTED: dynein heavy chain 17, axonemal-like [Latimeria chalumnae]|eukprot:XP_005988673.1 PREDICTED: dynein heavy chain 17, axonemal-like [Latimeria chalumnae]